MEEFAEKVWGSPLHSRFSPTPMDEAPQLSAELDNDVFLKREDMHEVHSFKQRGAFSKMLTLTYEQADAGVMCASAGNHAQGVAFAAQELGMSACIVMPQTTPDVKVAAVRSFGADIILFGDSYSEAAEHCQQLAATNNRTIIHPFDDIDVIAGQATMVPEILDDLHHPDYVFVPVGGGGLIAGVAAALKDIDPHVRVIGVEPEDSAAMTRSLATGERIMLEHVGIFADGVAVKQVGALTLELASKYVDGMVTVSNDQICDAIKAGYLENRVILEPAGALAIAGACKFLPEHAVTGKNIVCINSGANMAFERLEFVAERTKTSSGNERLLAINLDEKPGALRQLCRDVINGHAITEFCYRLQTHEQATILLGIKTHDPDDGARLNHALSDNAYIYTDLTNDDVTKEHYRHMVGGKSTAALEERVYSIDLPERPGALADLLDQLSNEHNISLFHYRNLGGDIGRVLIGFEYGADVHKLLHGYAVIDVSHLDSTQLFVGS